MTDTDRSATRLDVAYYYPEPYWHTGEVDSLKTLLLFFDQIATLLPRYMRGRERAADPILAGPLADQGLLLILEPESFVDKRMTEELSTILVELITGGAFDDLDHAVHYAELSRSRMGWDADIDLAAMVVEELESRGLARPSEDGVSIPLHPTVRTTILILLSQLARAAGERRGMNLHPTTGTIGPMEDLMRTLDRAPMPSAGHVVALDLQTVGVNLTPIPLDEIIGFRETHGESYRAYARDLRRLIVELGPLASSEREQLLLDREEELADRAQELRRSAWKAWRLPFASFSLGAAGAAWTADGQNDVLGGLLALGGSILGALAMQQPTAGAYSYLFQAQQRLSRGNPNV